MKNYLRPSIVFLLLCAFLSSPMAAGDSGEPPDRLWNPVPYNVYLQEVSHKIPLKKSVTAIGLLNGQCYAVMEGRVLLLSGDQAEPVPSGPVGVKRLKNLDGVLRALSNEGISRLETGEWAPL